ncbi:MAG TPA: hypothetical protein VKE41_05690 [Roseiflexaceae bacterium]|nr:hypothetical protein [Roseiflexaceae bacterium]
MYQVDLRSQASKLVSLATQWRPAGRRQPAAAESRRRALSLRAALAGLANLATVRALPGVMANSVADHDPRDPRNW